jgi:hypothetical protein
MIGFELLHFIFSDSLQYLNTNTTLYNAILKAESEGSLLTEEARRAATTLRVDFEKGGIHLPKGCHLKFILRCSCQYLSVNLKHSSLFWQINLITSID